MLVINKWSKESHVENFLLFKSLDCIFETVNITICAWNNKHGIFYNKQADKLCTSSLT